MNRASMKYNISLEFIAAESAWKTWEIADFKAKILSRVCNSRAGFRHLNFLVKDDLPDSHETHKLKESGNEPL